jgi:hypothetical protein
MLGNSVYYIHAPSPAHKLEASRIYFDTIYESSFTGVLTSEDMLQVMIDSELWSSEEENELQSIPTRLDTLKVDMYHKYSKFKSSRMEQSRRMLARLRKRQDELSRRRHAYDLYTQTGLAHIFKLQYLISRNTMDENNQSIDLESEPEWMTRAMIEQYSSNRPDDASIRKLSQDGHWRMIWSSGKQEGSIFGVPSIHLTDEQQILIAWSKMYDNINEHTSPPVKEVIEDDDLLDGWIITEQKNREKEQRENSGAQTGKNGAQEVYVPVDTAKDAKRVEAMNDPTMAFIKRQRMAALKHNKVVGEENMPDSKQQISVQAAQQFRDRMKQRR